MMLNMSFTTLKKGRNIALTSLEYFKKYPVKISPENITIISENHLITGIKRPI